MQDFFDKKLFDFSKLQGDEATLKKGLAVVAESLLPKVKLVNTILGRPLLAMQVKKMFNQAAADIRAGKFDAQLEKVSGDLKAVSRDEIRNMIADKLNLASDPAAARAHAEKFQKSINDLSEAEYVSLVQATYAVLPDFMQKVYDAVLLEQSSLEDYARRSYRMTIEEKVKYQQDMTAKVPVDALADLVHDMLQKASKAEMQVVVSHILTTVSADDAANIAVNGVGFAEDLFKMVKEKKTLDVKDRKKAESFGKGLKKLFNAAEAGFVKAGLMNPADVDALLKKSFNKGSANDNKTANKNDKKGPKFG